AREFQLPGRTTWQLGQLMVNGIAFSIDEHTRFKAGLSADTLGGDWVELEGVERAGVRYVREIEPLDEDETDEMDLEGNVHAGRIWGYVSQDASLAPFEGQWVELECQFDGMRLRRCRLDD
ncbi:MAG: DUF5666 domain-containing protein, partial [Shewanella sp.]